MSRGWRYAVVYAGWILLCAGVFAGLRGAGDPSRRPGRILSDDAGSRALAILRTSEPFRAARYEAVHVAFAGSGEGGQVARWVVLCDRVPHSALTQAVVVELRAVDGQLLTIRPPVSY